MVNFFAALRLCPRGVKDVHDMLVSLVPQCWMPLHISYCNLPVKGWQALRSNDHVCEVFCLWTSRVL